MAGEDGTGLKGPEWTERGGARHHRAAGERMAGDGNRGLDPPSDLQAADSPPVRSVALKRVLLTPEEMAALLQGLSQRESDLGAAPEPAPEPTGPPGVRVRGRRRPGAGFRKISQWFAAFTALRWPQL